MMTNEPVPQIGGSLDGMRERSPQEFLAESLGPVKTYATAVYRSAKPLSSFFAYSSPPTAPESLSTRMQSNLKLYAGNYMLLATGLACIFLLRTPSALFPLVALGASWIYVLRRNEDPTWQPIIAGYQLDKGSRRTALMAVTFVVLLLFALDLAIYTAFVCAILIGVHAAVNPGSKHEEVGIKETDALNQI